MNIEIGTNWLTILTTEPSMCYEEITSNRRGPMGKESDVTKVSYQGSP